jgi:broad specificity phosphatase PhoE
MKFDTKLIIVRHGQSLGNANKIFLGHTDLDMSEQGYLQANATAEHLKNEKIDEIYSSDLKRAYNTALPHAKLHNLEVKTSKNLREAYVGQWENQSKDDIIAKWGREAFEIYWTNHFGTFVFPEGESIAEAGERFYNEILTICHKNQGKTILIAAHAAVIRAFWGIISSISWENIADTIPFSSNASYSIAYFDGEKVIPEEYSIDAHLSDVGITKVNY